MFYGILIAHETLWGRPIVSPVKIKNHFKKFLYKDFIGIGHEKAFITRGRYSLRKASVDPTDDMFLACAMEAKADYIVSRDPHLRNLKHFHGIRISDVKAFVERVKKG